MAKPNTRPYSRYGLEAAERAGISRGLAHRIGNGETGCSIGAAFKLAAIVGVPLFEAEPSTMAAATWGSKGPFPSPLS